MNNLKAATIFLFSAFVTANLLLSPYYALHGAAAPISRQSEFGDPYLVKDINPRTHGSGPRCVAAAEDYAVCTGYDGFPRTRIWRSDGTAAGTWLLKDLFDEHEGALDLNDTAATASGKLYFVATEGCCSYEDQLWQTDGTSAGTVMVKAFPSSSYPHSLVTIGEMLYFLSAGDGLDTFGALWKSDGTEAGTEPIIEFTSPVYGVIRNLAAHDGQIYFQNRSTDKGIELWVSDGSTANTTMLIDIYPGEESSSPDQLTAAGGYLYFTADDGTHGRELWQTDGTVGGTKMVKDFSPDAGSSDPEYLTAAGDLLFFTANDEGRGFWRTDGTETGLVNLKSDIVLDDSPTAAGNLVYFLFYGQDFRRFLGRSDGTPAGTFPLMEMMLEPWTNAYVLCLQGYSREAAGNSIYFPYGTEPAGCELWRSDGTVAGTKMVQDILTGSASSHATPLASVNDRMLLRVANFPTDDYSIEGLDDELWVTDGSPTGAELLLDINRTPLSSEPSQFAAFENRIFFAANDGSVGYEPWSSDGTETGTTLVADVRPGKWGSNPRPLGATSSGMVFSAYSNGNDLELYAGDGTGSGLAKYYTFSIAPEYAYVQQMANWNGYVFFTVFYADETREFWRTDGTAEGTLRLGEFYVQHMIPADSQLYFVQRDDSGSLYALGMTDGTTGGTEQIDGVPESQCELARDQLVSLGDALFFAWCDDEQDLELWYLENPAAQAVRVTEINPQESSVPRSLAVYENSVFFTANDGEHGDALWRSDGAEQGTKLVAETPAYQITPYSAGIFFWFDGLWVSDGTDGGTNKLADTTYSSEWVVAADHLFFPGNYAGDSGSSTLMVSDGTTEGTVTVGTGDTPSDPRDLFVSDVRLFFTAEDEYADRELWALALGQPPPVADFSASPLQGAPSLQVYFQNLSTGSFESCIWDFGDGDQAESCDHQQHTYNSLGIYTVSLSVSGPGGQDTKTCEQCIHVEMHTIFLPAVWD